MNYFPRKDIKLMKAFKYNKPMGRLIFNCNSVEVDKKDINLCDFDNNKNFTDKNYGHIITGNLDI